MRPFATLAQVLSQAGATAHTQAAQGIAERDGLTVLVQGHQHRHSALRAGDAELDAIHQAIQQLRDVQRAAQQFVTHRRPRRFARRHDADTVFVIETKCGGHHYRRAVGKRQIADPHLFLFDRQCG